MFSGYNEKAVEFMWGIRLNNNREWFMAHKADYLEYLYQPTLALGQEVQAGFLERFPKLPLNLHVCRIYRDARRLHGQGPYKDHLWLTLREENDIWTQKPVFWFEFTPDGYSYGVGFWNASAQTMAAMRRDIDGDPKRLEKLARRLNRHPVFTLQGSEYARTKTTAVKLLQPWYNKKTVSIGADLPLDETVYSPALTDTLVEGFSFLVPYYQYFDSFCQAGLEDLR